MPNKILTIIIFLFVVMVSLSIVMCNDRIRNSTYFVLMDMEYFRWKTYGGPFQNDYYKSFSHDPFRNDIIAGISESEIIKKLPFLISDDLFDRSKFMYKGDNNFTDKTTGDINRYFWFKDTDTVDYRVHIVNGIGINIELIKG